jgi:hypothetical protein
LSSELQLGKKDFVSSAANHRHDATFSIPADKGREFGGSLKREKEGKKKRGKT